MLRVTLEAVHGNQVHLDWTETFGGFWNGGSTPGVPLDFPVERRPLAVRRECQNPFLLKQGKDPSSGVEEGERGLLLSCGWTLSVPLEWRWLCRGTS